jgi:ribulose-5-phosphate 4-epimerase/fuculose-1-phosphate aldolase
MDARVPDAETLRAARIDLAAALRWAVRYGLHEGICNHFSVAVSPRGDVFLVNPFGLHWSEIRASDLLLVDAEGRVLEGDDRPEDTAFFIHSRLHLHLPQARCVLHTHMPYATALTSVEGGRVEPINQNALRFVDGIAYDDDYNGLVLGPDEGDRMARAMGNRSLLFLANHGVIVAGPSVAQAFDTLYYLERTCQNQVLAMRTGLPLKHVSPAIAEATRQQIAGCEAHAAATHFTALKRILDREEPDYSS